MSRPAVTIIGAGVVGLATAATLVSRGHPVTIIDREGPAAGASRGNAGGIAWTDVAPLASPGIWKQALKWMADPLGPLTVRPAYAIKILPWMLHFLAASSKTRVAASTKAIADLNGEAMPAWERVWKLTGTHNHVRRNGCIDVFDNAEKLAASRAGWQEQRDHGVQVTEISRDELLDLVPDLASHVVGGALVPGWAQVDDPLHLCRSLAGWLEAQGVEFLRKDVVAVVPVTSGAEIRLADGSVLKADKVLIACGAWSKKLATGLGDAIPLDTERGYNITIPNPGIELRHFIMLPGHGFVLSPLSTGLRIGGAVEFGGLDLSPNWARVDAMIKRAKGLFPKLDASQGERWMGFRPSIPDSLPVIGPSTASRDILYAFGHAHHGLTQSAVTGECIADLIADDQPPIDLTPYRATRF